MTSNVKLRKVGVLDYDTQIKEVRCQLLDQLKVLDLQLEQKSQQLQDLTDYLRRRSEIEGEYARSLDKLSERFTSKIKRKEPCSGQSVAQCWLVLLAQTRQESRDHSGLSEICRTTLTEPLTHCLDITQRLAKRSKDVCTQLQDGLLKVTTELQTAWRTYYQYHSDYVSAEGKLKEAEKQKQGASKKIEKRQCKVQEIQLKCTKARNDYLLNLAAANASMNKYYLQDISSLIDCSDVGYHLSLSRVLLAYLSSRSWDQQNLSVGLQQLQSAVSGLDQSQDRDNLLQTHTNSFCLPLRFHFQPHDGDQVFEVSAEQEIRGEMETRFQQLQSKLTGFKQETEEADKTLRAARVTLLEGISDDDLDPPPSSSQTQGSQVHLQSPSQSQGQGGSNESLASSSGRPSLARRRANLQETEILYCTKVKEYLCKSSLVSKLQAKHDLLKVAVEKAEATNGHQASGNSRKSVRARMEGQPIIQFTHKLFTGDMLSFIKASGQEIPVVVESCIRFINLNGLHHEGIFRVPGSQAEVNSLRDAFERGEDPLADSRCDMDLVAGVLKLYFRTLENPLFPQDSTSQLLEYAEIDNETERAAQLKSVISSYPPPVIIVMRYLFAFLHHVSQYSDENMMQPYNLAVCFGPSLVRGLQDEDVVTLQPQINSLVKGLILQHESIFPSPTELQGPVYEKCMTLEQDDCEEGEGDSEILSKESESKGERSRSNSSCSSRPSPAGGSVSLGENFTIQIPMAGPALHGRPRSPRYIRKEVQDLSSSEDITVQVDKEVCHQMSSVFKELIARQSFPPPSSSTPPVTSSRSSKPPPEQKKGGVGRRRERPV
ncbi:SLIT-ROBO Rho GTPase-activating protein 3 isoform X4 [Oncorhynchus kisutch]|uniref:SLIT-ROBO Rho GTPase-activating protein 3 isoform X4 n=1 Tax=Oncorhynchus kisutch TaxID=8019 RepID=UPI0012DE8C2F|nr:SLIT-ROBO Rho GTPase-activating protein 3 isoform X4 [Oncorhynchus kisutch]XP_031659366.1 SLIT-ROBO Rho GTPase-activating protein 3 isoform X4 [Oncorhynchus kisutch]